MLIDIINRQCKESSVSLLIVNDKVNTGLLNTIDEKVNIYTLGRKESNKLQLFSVFCKINQIIKKIDPDVIHCHDNNLFPFFINRRKKTCLTVHNVRLSTSFLRSYKVVFAISKAVRDDIEQRVGIFAPIVYNGIEIKQYRQRFLYEFNKDKEVFQIVLLSRLFPEQKGQHIAMQSIRILKKQDLNVKLYLIGGGEAAEFIRMKALAVEYGIDGDVEFVGQMDREWIKNNLRNYHVLIQPSLYEGFGLTVIEGFACGLPVVASDLDGPKEICQLLNAGLLVHANDPADLAEKIVLIYQSYVLNALKDDNYILSNHSQLEIFDIQTTAKTYLDNYVLINSEQSS